MAKKVELRFDKLKSLEGKYVFFERYIKKGHSIQMPGKVLKVYKNSLVIRQHANGDLINFQDWEDDVFLKDIISMYKLNLFDRLQLILKGIH